LFVSYSRLGPAKGDIQEKGFDPAGWRTDPTRIFPVPASIGKHG
jgi:hypothetical protein